MKKKAIHAAITTLTILFLLLTALSGCGRQNKAAETAAPVLTAAPVSPTEAPETVPESPAVETVPESAAETLRQVGERFEDVIMLEGMEETVRYEHIRNDAIGIEMDYEYESLVRSSESARECFTSIWDDPENPENYLEVMYSPENADAVSAFISEMLSQEYELLKVSRELERAGSCIRIEASEIKGTNTMADQLQVAYIIPAPDGCRVAMAHYSIESAEGFGRRFYYMLNTLTIIDRNDEGDHYAAN